MKKPKWTVQVCRASRVNWSELKGFGITEEQNPLFGFAWWFWTPYLKVEKWMFGGQCTTLFWLCFFITVYREGTE